MRLLLKRREKLPTQNFGNYGIQHTGLLGETASLLYSFGYVGTISLFFMGLSIIFSLKNKRLALGNLFILFVGFSVLL